MKPIDPTMTQTPEDMDFRIDRIEADVEKMQAHQAECDRWTAEHDGRINAYWEQQFKTNAEVKDRGDKQGERITGIERKVMYISGFAAAVGGVIGGLASKGMG